MARRRVISPQIWQSEDFSNLSLLARLTFIGLFSNADDEGRGHAKAGYVKSTVFPYDDGMRVSDIDKALSEIASNVSVTFYAHDGKEYYSLDNWSEWQKVERATPSKLPSPEEGERIRIPQKCAEKSNILTVSSKSVNPHRQITEESPTNHRSLGEESAPNISKEKKSKDKIGTDGLRACARETDGPQETEGESEKIDPFMSEFFGKYRFTEYPSGDMTKYDFKALLERFAESEFLRNTYSWGWVVKNYANILAGVYKDFPKRQGKKEGKGSKGMSDGLIHNYSSEELADILSGIQKTEFF